ncbi:ubiquitin carboxyl-terminal hydrolase [Thecamonas trahens ATCC 50062]|uniref:ubiquitinyl hydrolase 1 n=1 Tax=Thecamonas trahens ATCC 50062 TaxID=461836 RepID=A0A0L0DSJ1_THETB|nr:ubiquitin carboxyl-terminal hydrolase [Thecamonas trahens ATCC 50062]KNC55177.1 ubiquitin carboxyl-terminal hydrolase [Thecamonas trahens ATCC 50062]|eukprot:XP_013753229.1 ubiquitin carboxyl-terminal hydrolase [Thecamonas trahens ATCC 50062]
MRALMATEGMTEALRSMQTMVGDDGLGNPLAFDGRLFASYLDLVELVEQAAAGRGSGSGSCVAPAAFKHVMDGLAPSFKGHAQHDAHELWSFLLDGLHEETNVARAQRAETEGEEEPEDDGQRTGRVTTMVEHRAKEASDAEAAAAWRRYVASNASPVTGMFAGLLRSLVLCDSCGLGSTTFDPFTSLALPVPPDPPATVKVTVVPAVADGRFVQYTVDAETYEDVEEISEAVSELVGISSDALLPVIIVGSGFGEYVPESRESDELAYGDGSLYLYQVAPPDELASGAVIRLPVCHRANFAVETEVYDAATEGYVVRRVVRQEYLGLPLMLSTPPVVKYSELKKQILSAMAHYVSVPDTVSLNNSEADADAVAGFRAWFHEYMMLLAAAAEAAQADSDFDSDYDELDAGYFPQVEPGLPLSLAAARGELFTLMADGIDQSAVDAGIDQDLVLSPDTYVVVEWNEQVVWEAYSLSRLADCEYDETSLAGSQRGALAPTLDNAVAAFAAPQVVSGDGGWRCPACEAGGRATQMLSIELPPPMLVVHLKRFVQDEASGRLAKKHAFVDAPLVGFSLPVTGGGASAGYSLYAVVNHYGGLGGGHYTAHVCGDNGVWWTYNDSRVSETQEASVVSSAAYLLLYRRNDQGLLQASS